MAITIGCSWTKGLILKSKKTGQPISLVGASFALGFRDDEGTTEILKLTTAIGGIVIEDAAAGKLRFNITAGESASFPAAGNYRFDLIRLDLDSRRYAKGTIEVENRITS
jgi:hypothetical protein